MARKIGFQTRPQPNTKLGLDRPLLYFLHKPEYKTTHPTTKKLNRSDTGRTCVTQGYSDNRVIIRLDLLTLMTQLKHGTTLCELF